MDLTSDTRLALAFLTLTYETLQYFSEVSGFIALQEVTRCFLFLVTGRTTLGSDGTDIPLQGPGIAAQHCYIENQGGNITLYPCGNQCSVDGLPVTKPYRLTQGRRAIGIKSRYILHIK